MKKAEQCRKLCSTTVPASSAKFINERINQHYAIHWLVDGLPAAKARFNQNDELVLSIGFNLGYKDQFTSQSLVNNHYGAFVSQNLGSRPDSPNVFCTEILIDYHERGPGDLRIVGVLVSPSSKAHNGQGDCAEEVPLHLEETQDTDLAFTYDVTWRKSETTWATRWDSILKIRDPKVHWLSLINSLVVAFFLCAMVLVVLNKASAKDIDRFNAIDLGEDVQEEYGWKLVAGEVFRQPQRPMLLSVVVGTGRYQSRLHVKFFYVESNITVNWPG